MFHNIASLPIGLFLATTTVPQTTNQLTDLDKLVDYAGVFGFFLSLFLALVSAKKYFTKPKIISSEIYNCMLRKSDPIGYLFVITMLVDNRSSRSISLFSAELETEAFTEDGKKPCILYSVPVSSDGTFQIVPTLPGVIIPAVLKKSFQSAAFFPCAIKNENTGLFAMFFYSATDTKLFRDGEIAFQEYRKMLEDKVKDTGKDIHYAKEQLISLSNKKQPIFFIKKNRKDDQSPSVKIKGKFITSIGDLEFESVANIRMLSEGSHSLNPLD